jgi:hypothetical protein
MLDFPREARDFSPLSGGLPVFRGNTEKFTEK